MREDAAELLGDVRPVHAREVDGAHLPASRVNCAAVMAAFSITAKHAM